MSEQTDFDFDFNFKFNLHKSLIPIGIDDHDYKRLAVVYGVDSKTLNDVVEKNEKNNEKYANKLKEEFDLNKLDKKPLKIEFLGDSITSDRQSYLNIIKKALEGKQNISIVDFSISGHKSGDLFTATYPNVINEHADIAHIMIGTNDVRRIDDENRAYHTGPEEFEKNVDYVVSELTKDGTKVILSTIPPFSQEKAKKNFVGFKMLFLEEDRILFNNIVKKIASKYGATVNDMDPSYSKYDTKELTLIDGIHLNEIGHDLLSQGVMKSILNVL